MIGCNQKTTVIIPENVFTVVFLCVLHFEKDTVIYSPYACLPAVDALGSLPVHCI